MDIDDNAGKCPRRKYFRISQIIFCKQIILFIINFPFCFDTLAYENAN